MPSFNPVYSRSKFGATEQLHGTMVPWTANVEYRAGAVIIICCMLIAGGSALGRPLLALIALLLLLHCRSMYAEAKKRMCSGGLSGAQLSTHAWQGAALGSIDGDSFTGIEPPRGLPAMRLPHHATSNS